MLILILFLFGGRPVKKNTPDTDVERKEGIRATRADDGGRRGETTLCVAVDVADKQWPSTTSNSYYIATASWTCTDTTR